MNSWQSSCQHFFWVIWEKKLRGRRDWSHFTRYLLIELEFFWSYEFVGWVVHAVLGGLLNVVDFLEVYPVIFLAVVLDWFFVHVIVPENALDLGVLRV
jgi:hypothetical protein